MIHRTWPSPTRHLPTKDRQGPDYAKVGQINPEPLNRVWSGHLQRSEYTGTPENRAAIILQPHHAEALQPPHQADGTSKSP